EGRGRPIGVERRAPIGDQDDGDATGSEHPMDLVEDPERIGDVFEDMGSDDEVRAGIAERAQSVTIQVGHDIGTRELGLVQLGEERPIRVGLPPVDVADRRPADGQGKGHMAGAELEAVADQMTGPRPPDDVVVRQGWRQYPWPSCVPPPAFASSYSTTTVAR